MPDKPVSASNSRLSQHHFLGLVVLSIFVVIAGVRWLTITNWQSQGMVEFIYLAVATPIVLRIAFRPKFFPAAPNRDSPRWWVHLLSAFIGLGVIVFAVGIFLGLILMWADARFCVVVIGSAGMFVTLSLILRDCLGAWRPNQAR